MLELETSETASRAHPILPVILDFSWNGDQMIIFGGQPA
jgi:hypothetical protein